MSTYIEKITSKIIKKSKKKNKSKGVVLLDVDLSYQEIKDIYLKSIYYKGKMSKIQKIKFLNDFTLSKKISESILIELEGQDEDDN